MGAVCIQAAPACLLRIRPCCLWPAEGNVCIARSTVAYRAGKCFGVVAVEAAIDIVFPRTRARDVAEFTVAQDIGIFEINPFGTARQFAAQFAAAVAVIGSKHAGEEVVASRCVLDLALKP